MFSIGIALLLQAAPAEMPPAAVSASLEDQTAPVGEQIDAAQSDASEPQKPTSIQITVPKGHKILISVEGQVGSKISKAKDFFPIKLADPVAIDGVEILPAGIEGEGQVVHAAKSGFGGSAGELILAARYLMHGDRKIMLRSFKWIEEGDEFLFRGADNTGAVLATNALLGPLGLLIGGGNTTIEPGTVATAKFRADESFEFVDERGIE